MRTISLVFGASFLFFALPARVGTQVQPTPTFNQDIAPIVFNNCATAIAPTRSLR